MPGTRSSARLAANTSSPNRSQEEKSSPKATASRKRKADTGDSPQSKRGKNGTPKKTQQTLEETIGADKGEEDVPKDIEMKEAADEGEGTDKQPGEVEAPEAEKAGDVESDKRAEEPTNPEPQEAEASNEDTEQTQKKDEGPTGTEPSKDEAASGEAQQAGDKDEQADGPGATGANGNSVIEHSERAEKIPSSILEKGFIYFFTRGRVGIEEPEGIQDLQRSYIVLRPIPKDAKIGEGAIEDMMNNRLLALPKKFLPKSHRDRFMVFVEKANTSIEDLKENFFKGSQYETKTAGTRQTPPVAPVGEGVYALTTTGRESHLAYMLTIPSQIGEVQEEMGIRQKGSFIISLKNPTVKGPANASLPQGPDFPEEILADFQGRSWTSVRPAHLDYENAQILLIGEGIGEVGKALEQTEKDKKHDTETPLEEMEKLEHEDEIRVKHLHGDDSVFDDLGLSHKEYPKVLTTW